MYVYGVWKVASYSCPTTTGPTLSRNANANTIPTVRNEIENFHQVHGETLQCTRPGFPWSCDVATYVLTIRVDRRENLVIDIIWKYTATEENNIRINRVEG